ncbi:spore coat protein [Eubacteriales bacterium OttesenSCG-928-M02]|nr:spore coat protein [Eubacteriales bacterium OttesenSCG-928-M02]
MQHNTPNMTEKELMTDMLNYQKHLMSIYTSSLAETADPQLRNTLQSHFSTIANDQFKLWQLMNQKGYYPIEQADMEKLTQQKQAAQQMQSTLN